MRYDCLVLSAHLYDLNTLDREVSSGESRAGGEDGLDV